MHFKITPYPPFGHWIISLGFCELPQAIALYSCPNKCRWVLSPPEYTMSGCDTFESSRIPDGIVLFPVSSISVRSNHNVKYLSPCTQWDDINIFSKPNQERTWKKTMVSVFNSTGVCLFGPHQFEWAFTSPPQSNSIMEEKAFALVEKYLLPKKYCKKLRHNTSRFVNAYLMNDNVLLPWCGFYSVDM